MKITLGLLALVFILVAQSAFASIPSGTRTEVTSSGARSWIVHMDAAPDEWAFCMEIQDSAPRIGDGYNVIDGSETHEGSTTRDRIAAAMNALDDSYFTSRYTEAQITDGLNRAIWAYTDGHNSSNSIAQAIRSRVSDGRYQPMDVTWYRHASNPRDYQDMVSITPETGKIGDTIWNDINGNGIQDEGEAGIPNVTVQLTAPDGTMIEVDTDENGNYLFDDLADGEYTVTVIDVPAGTNNTGDPDGGAENTAQVTITDAKDNFDQDFGYQELGTIGDILWNDVNGNGTQDEGETGIGGITVELSGPSGTSTQTTASDGAYLFTDLLAGEYTVTVINPPAGTANTGDPQDDGNSTSTITLGVGEDNLDQDFGYQELGTIGDTIWDDLNGNGTQEEGEAGIEGIIVELTGPAGTFTQTTVADGQYLFTDLPDGDYTVTVLNPPAGTANTGDPQDDGNSTSTITLGVGEDNLDQDFGYQELGTIGDTIWADLNGNGTQEEGEAGIEGIIVELAGPSGTFTQTTIEDGQYLFTDLPDGDYTVTVLNPPAGTANTGDPQDDGNSTSTLTLGVGEDNLDQDFGYVALLSVGDAVWFDADADGIQDDNAEEAGIDGVTVTLQASDGTVIETVTDDGGLYLFEGLEAGTYQIVIPAGQDGIGEPLEGLINTTGDADPDDSSANDDDNGIIAADGSVESAEFSLVYGGEPTDDDDDNDPNSDLTIDFGFHALHSIGSSVFIDSDDNGLQDSSEGGIAGVRVDLLDSNGMPVLDINGNAITTTTNDAGDYFFGDLLPGAYRIRVTPSISYPVSSTDTITGTMPDNNLDGDDNGIGQISSGSVVTSGIITLTVGAEPVDATNPLSVTNGVELALGSSNGHTQDNDEPGEIDANGNMTVDFGFRPELVSVGDLVWLDANKNGIQDGGAAEPGINGVTVQLFQIGDFITETTLISQTVTVSKTVIVSGTEIVQNGSYLFDNLSPGTYQIVIPGLQPALIQYVNSNIADSDGSIEGSAPDPDTDSTLDDDNGIDPAINTPGQIVKSEPFDLIYNGEPTTDLDGDPNTDLTIDFGFHPEVLESGG